MVLEANLTGLAYEAPPRLALYAYLQRFLSGWAEILINYALGWARAETRVTRDGRPYPMELTGEDASEDDSPRAESVRRSRGHAEKLGVSDGWSLVSDKDFSETAGR
ncbi:MAG: hypothetical protein LBO66_01245 [Deltaproteobacteria bacterium]|jgi:hypothetical protein|nr:hypothetical protein [Deltaproteobacteria bacterium]